MTVRNRKIRHKLPPSTSVNHSLENPTCVMALKILRGHYSWHAVVVQHCSSLPAASGVSELVQRITSDLGAMLVLIIPSRL